jgi:hypothetical protein
MTVAFDPAAILQAPAAPDAAAALIGQEEPAGFAALLTGRALLDAPRSATLTSLRCRNGETVREASAPAALRFDEAPLFGQAFLIERAGPGAPAKPSAPETMATAANPAAADLAEAVSRPVDMRAVQLAPPPIGLPTHAAPLPHGAHPMAGRAAGGSAAAVRSAEPSGMPLSAIATGEPAAACVRRRETPSSLAESAAAARITAAAPQRAVAAASPDERGIAGNPGERAREARIRFVERLRPFHVVLRETAGGLDLAARVGALPAGKEDLLERRLRGAAAEEGRVLSGLRINGRARAGAWLS